MIYLKSPMPITGREDVWASEVRVKTLTPARRDKLVALLNLAGFSLRQGDGTDSIVGEITEWNGEYLIRSS